MSVVVSRSKVKAPSYRNQLTLWADEPGELSFAMVQLDKYDAPWVLKQDNKTKKYAVFIPKDQNAPTRSYS